MKRKNLILTALLTLSCSSLFAIQQPDVTGAQSLVFKAPELEVSELNMPTSNLANAEKIRAQRLGATADRTQVDLRTGRFATLTPSVPLLPGKGYGNHLSWRSAGIAEPKTRGEMQQMAWSALRGWLVANAENLQLDPAELPDSARVTVVSPDYFQIYVPRRVAGYPVRNSHLTATIKYGNLIMVSAFQWGDVDTVLRAQLSEQDAQAALQHQVGSFSLGQSWKGAQLMWIPVSTATTLTENEMGRGLAHRLAWVLRPTFGEQGAHFEAIVDAVNGEVLAIEDQHQYATARSVDGGAYPVSNDGVNPDGIEQPDSPMSYSNIVTTSGTVTTDVGGNLPVCADGTITGNLTGKYVTITDNCGAPSLSSTGDIDWGVSSGTDCTTPGFGGPGNTHASRTGYFELNQLKAMARGQLPTNTWLQDNLTSNMNINNTCNAFWNGATVNFYRSGGGCFNTGELAGVFDHEWGHGLDDNDAVPNVSLPGEGIADVYASLRLDDSCIGRHFRSTNCGGYGNPCTACTGIREIDWAAHTGNFPFTMTNADACGAGNTNGPCGGSVHCEGQIYSQTIWDLWNRDLAAAPFNYGHDLARELGTQLTFRGASGVQNWFSCTAGTGGCGNPAGCGCAGTSGYQQFLLADDDNGNLNDGTPHMAAIFAAFNRHGIACGTPTVTTAGCSGTPTQVPVVTATAIDRGVSLSWTASAGATGYRVYRTDGVFNCSFGKELLATVTGTTYADDGLKNGRNYYYQVVPMGPQDECFAVASSCTTGTPAAGPNLGFGDSTLALLTGDGDPYLDNCETGRATVPVSNTGNATQTNVRITSVTSPSHPGTVVLTALPHTVSASLASCDSTSTTFDFSPTTLANGDVLTLEVEMVSDQMPIPRKATISISGVEGDLQNFPSKTFTFEAGTESWQTIEGTFTRSSTGGGGSGTSFYFKSSEFLDDQCDVVRSPVMRLNADSTMTLQNQYNIEAFSGQWWDRANVGIRPLGSSTRTAVNPSGGRLYNASGTGGTCGTDFEGGWADANTSWGASSWTATALQSATFAGQLMQLEVRYGTDAGGNDFGFHFDEVNLTNVDLEVADAQSNACSAFPLFEDGFETGDTTLWSVTTP